jgi:hypothetical protein
MTSDYGHTASLTPGLARSNLTYRARVRWLIELLCLGFYLCLIYKRADGGILVLCLIVVLGSLIRLRVAYLFSLLGTTTVLYLAMSTVTAFIVGPELGIYRSAQFVVLLAAFVVMSNYFEQLDAPRMDAFCRRFVYITIAIFLHMIAYHLYTGRYTTWKYLFDTKTVISVVAVILFLKEDIIKHRLGARGWWLLLGSFSLLCLLSGERKAYILTAILFLLSRASLFQKIAVGFLIAAGLLLYVVGAPPGGYVAKQIDSLFSEKREMPMSEYYGNDLVTDQSDLIRDFVNRNAWQLFLEHPVFGIGANGYYELAKVQFDPDDQHIGLGTNVHGEINRVPVEGGLVGIAIALFYMSALAFSVFQDFWRKGMFHSPSAERFPIYTFIFLFLYMYVEALDSLMLSLIVLFGFHMAKVSSAGAGKVGGRVA